MTHGREGQLDSMNEKRIIGFQGLRGFAILLIVLSHCTWKVNGYGQNILSYAGGWGVQLFIMLSGFLAALHYPNVNFEIKDSKELCRHKLQKYYWLHIVTLLAALPISLSVLHGGLLISDIVKVVSNVFLVQSWVPLHAVYFSMNAVSWYLSLDLAFAFMLPVLIRIIWQMQGKAVIAWIVGVVLLEFALSFGVQAFVNDTGVAHWVIYVCPIIRSLDFIIGGLQCRHSKGRGASG